MRDRRFLVAGWWRDSRYPLPENNCWIYDTRGDVEAEFFVGGPSDLLVGDDYIVTINSDQAIFGNDPMGKEGIAAFDLNGERFWGCRSDFDGVDIYDCYAACIDDTGHLLAYPYATPNFPLITLGVRAKSQEITRTPKILHGSHAITTLGETILFWGPYKAKNTVYVWTPSDEPQSVGTINECVQRGLRNGRFMSIEEDGFIVWRYEPD